MTETDDPGTAGGAAPVDVGVETPEADAVEQAQGGPAAAPPTAVLRDDVPEADAVEQAQGTAVAETPRLVREIPDGVPEADALEQAYEVDLEDDYRA